MLQCCPLFHRALLLQVLQRNDDSALQVVNLADQKTNAHLLIIKHICQ